MTRKVKLVGELASKCDHLTVGKEYTLLDVSGWGRTEGDFITFLDDHGEEVYENIEWRFHVGENCEWVFV